MITIDSMISWMWIANCVWLNFCTSIMQVTFSTSQHLSPDAIDATNYRIVTNLRVQFIDLFIELLISAQGNQYFSVSEWLIWGSCSCNGHAALCTPASGEAMTANKVTIIMITLYHCHYPWCSLLSVKSRRCTLDAPVSIALKGIAVKCVRWDLIVSHGCLEHHQLQINVKVHHNSIIVCIMIWIMSVYLTL